MLNYIFCISTAWLPCSTTSFVWTGGWLCSIPFGTAVRRCASVSLPRWLRSLTIRCSTCLSGSQTWPSRLRRKTSATLPGPSPPTSISCALSPPTCRNCSSTCPIRFCCTAFGAGREAELGVSENSRRSRLSFSITQHWYVSYSVLIRLVFKDKVFYIFHAAPALLPVEFPFNFFKVRNKDNFLNTLL